MVGSQKPQHKLPISKLPKSNLHLKPFPPLAALVRNPLKLKKVRRNLLFTIMI